MARTGWVRRQAMPLKDIPEDVRGAVLAAENASFYSDPGISVSGLTRAVWRTLGQGETQGGSTITQQYVKNVYLNQDRSVGRKFTEAMLALKLDNEMSKDDILEGYLNTSWFGRGTYGIQRAAQAYYGKDVGELDAGEAAFLASLLKGAALYDPALNEANHDRAVERWSWILDRMVDTGALSKAERARYKEFPEPLKRAPGFDTGKQSDYLVELAAQYAKKAAHLSAREFDLGGYQIYTTFDRKQETALTDAVDKARKKARKDDPAKAKSLHFGASSVATDGRILAVHGGPDHREQGYNESNATTVPAGSAFLPFVYAAALEHGVHTTRDGAAARSPPRRCTTGTTTSPSGHPRALTGTAAANRSPPTTTAGRSYGRIGLGRALALSVNTPFMQLGMDTGLDRVRDTAQRAGLLPSSFGPAGARDVPGQRHAQRDPYGERIRHVRRRRQACRAVLGGPRSPATAPVSRSTEPGSRRAVKASVAGAGPVRPPDAFRTARPGAVTTATVAGKAGTTQNDTAAWYVGTANSVSTAVVVYRIDLTKSLEPLPLDGIAGSSATASRTASGPVPAASADPHRRDPAPGTPHPGFRLPRR